MHKKLSNLLGVALIIIVVFKFILKDIPNYFYFDSEIKDVLVNVSYSYIAAYIFYLLQVWYPEERNRKILNNKLAGPLNRMLNDMQSTLKEFVTNSDFTEYESGILTNETLSSIDLLGLKSNFAVPIGVDETRPANHIEYIKYEKERIFRYIEQINSLNGIDLELNLICDDIKNSNLYSSLSVIETVISFKNYSGFPADFIADELNKYLATCYELRRYMNKNNIQFTISSL